jgi:hypothetical protein
MAKKIKKQKTVVKGMSVENDVIRKETSEIVTKFPKKAIQFTALLLVVAGLVYFAGKNLFVASVNGQLVSRLTVIKDLEKQGGKKVLETIIIKMLVNQEAKKRKISIPQKEIDMELPRIEKNVSSQGATLDALLLQQGMTKNDLIEEIKLQLLATKMVDQNVSATDKEVEAYIESQKEQSSTGLSQSTPEITTSQAKAAIKQQKIQNNVQLFISNLKANAKINYFVEY